MLQGVWVKTIKWTIGRDKFYKHNIFIFNVAARRVGQFGLGKEKPKFQIDKRFQGHHS
jgi:hypothetical protein